jgi:hypothetical protein
MEVEKIAMTEPTYRQNKRQNTKNSLSLPIIQIMPNNSNNINKDKTKNRKLYHSLNKSKSKNKKSTKRVPTTKRKERRIKINRDLDLVNKLNMELEVDELFQEETRLQKQKEKIDSNPDYIAKRLNIFKNSSDNGEKKIEVDSKEKEKYIEKEFKDELEAFTKMKNECNVINENINKIRDTIDDYQLELNVFNRYGDDLDKKCALEIQEKEKNKLMDSVMNNQNTENEENNEINPTESPKVIKNEKLEYLNSLANLKKQREEKIKTLTTKKEKAEEELIGLTKKYSELLEQCKQKKNIVYKARNQLLNIYHLELYEGLNFRTDGLASLIRSIWNIGVNVDINYMPSYLDKLSIDFLFDKARRLIKISEMRQIIEENQKDFENSISSWKKTLNENSKDSNEEKTDENFFKTGVMGNYNYNYMNKYPHSKKFMDDYNKKYFSKGESFEVKFTKNKKLFKSRNIPASIIEKHNKIEKLKILLNNLLEKNENIEKKEIERLCREFILNDYKEKYNVSIEVIMGALCGEEKRNEAITYFAKYQKEYKEGKQIIQFHKLNSKFNQK